ncbi:DUF4173 domain-containing protein [soil metagenome]
MITSSPSDVLLGHAADARIDAAAAIAPRVVAHAVLLGIAADLLLRDGIEGLGFPLWIATLLLGLTSLTWRARRDVPREAIAWMFVALLSACGLAWRDSEMLKGLDLVATAGALGMTAIALGNERAGLLADRVRDTLWAAASMARTMVPGIVPNLAEAIRSSRRDVRWESRSRRWMRTSLLALGVLVVFGSLLRSADPIFASLITTPEVDMGLLFSHVFLAAWFAWLVSGWANAALGSSMIAARAPNGFPFSLGIDDRTASLGVLNVLFGAFILAQLGWFFGGEQFLQSRTGLTAAEYARHGFFEMVWVVALVAPMLVISRGALAPNRGVARRHTLMAAPLLLLLVGIMVSAAARMQLYVHYYGLTVDRLYTLVLMAWLIPVLGWLALTVLRDRGRSFIAGVVVSAFSVLCALNVAAPDAIVARFNANRAHRVDDASGADLRHMSELSGDAVETALSVILARPRVSGGSLVRPEEERARCDATRNLLKSWGPLSKAAQRSADDAAWRTWNYGGHRALRAVSAHAVALVKVRNSACANVPNAGRSIVTY